MTLSHSGNRFSPPQLCRFAPTFLVTCFPNGGIFDQSSTNSHNHHQHPFWKNTLEFSQLHQAQPIWLFMLATHGLNLTYHPKSSRCIFLGYSTSKSACKCMNIATNCLYYSRHVQFIEHIFPFLDANISHTHPISITTFPSLQPLSPPPAINTHIPLTHLKYPNVQPIYQPIIPSDPTSSSSHIPQNSTNSPIQQTHSPTQPLPVTPTSTTLPTVSPTQSHPSHQYLWAISLPRFP